VAQFAQAPNESAAESAAALDASIAGATPAMAQYLTLKAAHKDYILFYRMGDFYELFFDDAVKASSILDIALTKRGKHDGADVPMCGVPVHSHDMYLERLIRSGCKVAICEQMENPAEAKKRGAKAVVHREVVRIVTPGTLTEESLLDARASNYLAALAQAGEFALSWLDISTGEFRVCALPATSVLAELARIAPRELLVADSLLENAALKPVFEEHKNRLTIQPGNLFEPARGERLIKEAYAVTSLQPFGLAGDAAVAACGALLDYVRLTQKANMPRLDAPRLQHSGEHMLIDAASSRNLELAATLSGQKQGSLLSTIDRTVTASGARLLAGMLASPSTHLPTIHARQDNVQSLVQTPLLKDELRRLLKTAPDMERALSRLALNRGGPRDMLSIAGGLQAAGAIAALLNAHTHNISEGLAHLGLPLVGHVPLAELLDKSLMPTAGMFARDGNFVADGYSQTLDDLRTLRDDSRKLIAALQQRYAEVTGINTLKIRHNNMIGYHIEITTANAGKVPFDFIHRQTMVGNMRYTTVELSELEQKISEAADRALRTELEIFASLLEAIMQQQSAIVDAARAIAALDVYSALAELATTQRYTRPTVDDSLSFAIENGRHPVVEASLAALGREGFIGNDCDLAPAQHLWLLTGPNMAGKSTFLRQNALIAILAQMGSFVPASSAHIGLVDRLFSRVGAADDLARGQSTFMVEMVETATILHQASNRSLVILDEIGRGTATFDGLSIAWAVVEYLHEHTRCRTLFATHYHELTELTQTLPALSCYSMQVKEWKGDLVFLHKVAKGTSDRSYGIHVARLAGLPASVIARASDILRQLEKSPTAKATTAALPLFSYAPAAPAPAADPETLAIIEELKNLTPDELTPKAALELLYKWKKPR